MEFIGKIKFMKEDLLTIAEFKKLIDARSPKKGKMTEKCLKLQI